MVCNSASLPLVGKDLGECPALESGNGAGLDDSDAVANDSFGFFVVHVVFLGALDNFLESWVRNAGDVLDNDGFIHFIGDNDAYACFAVAFRWGSGRSGFLW